jgi:hypothetical protein
MAEGGGSDMLLRRRLIRGLSSRESLYEENASEAMYFTGPDLDAHRKDNPWPR